MTDRCEGGGATPPSGVREVLLSDNLADADECPSLPGGFVVLVPMRARLGVCSFDDYSHALSCSSVVWNTHSFFYELDDNVPVAECQQECEAADGHTAMTEALGEVKGDKRDEIMFAAGGVVTWIADLVARFDLERLSVFTPPSVPRALTEVLNQLVAQRGGVVRTVTGNVGGMGHQQRRGGSRPALASSEALLSRLHSMWPQRDAMYWNSRFHWWHHSETVMALCIAIDVAKRLSSCMAQDSHCYVVADVVEKAPHTLMTIPPSTLDALHVFRRDTHPSAHHGIGAESKEGYSLFSLFLTFVKSSAGRELLMQWMKCPVSDIHELRRRQSVVAVLSLPEQQPLRKALLAIWSRIHTHPGKLIHRFRSGRHRSRDYAVLAQCAAALLELVQLLWPLRSTLPSVVGWWLESVDTDVVHRIVEVVRSTYDLQQGGSVPHAPFVRVGVDHELDELRAHYAQLGPQLTHLVQRIALGLPPPFSSWKLSCEYYPGVGYLLAVHHRTSDDWGAQVSRPVFGDETRNDDLQRMTLPPGWETVFAPTPDTTYCRTPHTVQLDETLGDVHGAIVAKEVQVRLAVDEQLLSMAPALLPLLNVAELECLNAFACVSADEGWVRPELRTHATSDGYDGSRVGTPPKSRYSLPRVEMRGAYHPLLSRLGRAVVPLSVTLGDGTDGCAGRVSLLTGPNGSGKTILMQTVGVVVYLAHLGCFVPASHTTMDVLDHVQFIDDVVVTAPSTMCDAPSSSAPSLSGGEVPASVASSDGGSSSFASELLEVSRAVSHATSRSLLLLDEFGRGTLALDGVALLASLLRSLAEGLPPPASAVLRSDVPIKPLVMVATHYTEVMNHRMGLVSLPSMQFIQMALAPSGGGPRGPIDNDASSADGYGEMVPDGEMFTYQTVVARGGGKGDERFAQRPTCFIAISCAARCGVPPFLVQRMHAASLAGVD